jgi:preprotein translocase subunit SecG
MNHLSGLAKFPGDIHRYIPAGIHGLEHSRAARMGHRLIMLAFGIKALNVVIMVSTIIGLGATSVFAQTPSGTFFNGNSSQLGNSLRSVTFFLAAAMIIAGIIFIAVGIITSGLRESLSTWKFITGAACFAFGGICAAVYAFSQGDTVALDNQF